ncbi:MAG: GerMN domain-containing protein [Clostridia bacterium]|nr:GerMN domain-containing protein [Clostridia bacterium]
MTFIRKPISLMLLTALILTALTGCAGLTNNSQSRTEAPRETSTTPLPVDPYEKARETQIVLYYKHEIADFLVPEVRTVMQEKKSTEELIVEELLKGPQGFQKVLVMPPSTEIIDVTRRNDTVFVNLTDDFLNPFDLSAIPGKENLPEEEVLAAQQEMKLFAIYSIVNSLTYLDGLNQVKIMVSNTQLSYRDMDADLLLQKNSILDLDSPMVALRRNKNVNQTPAETVRFFLNALITDPNWDILYPFLSNRTMDGNKLPPLDEFKAQISPIVGGMISFEGNLILDEEPLREKAFVTVQYTDKTVEPQKVVMEVLTLDYVDGIWKLRLPESFIQLR